jgi:hypothetical protein
MAATASQNERPNSAASSDEGFREFRSESARRNVRTRIASMSAAAKMVLGLQPEQRVDRGMQPAQQAYGLMYTDSIARPLGNPRHDGRRVAVVPVIEHVERAREPIVGKLGGCETGHRGPRGCLP